MARHRRSVRVALALSLLCFTIPAWAASFTIVHVNDSHSHLEAFGPKDPHLDGTLGGIAKAATVIRDARGPERQSLLLHAGDFYEGDIFFNATFGAAELALLKQIGFDAVTLGNHDVRYGADVFAYALSTISFQAPPLLSANLDVSGTSLAGLVLPSIVKTLDGGVRVGVFGMTNPYDPVQGSLGGNLLREGAMWDAAAQTVQALRAQVDVVVCLSHLGFALDQALVTEMDTRLLPLGVAGVDLVVGGHDHLSLDAPVAVPRADGGTTWIVQAGQNYEKVGRVEMSFDPLTGVRLLDGALLPVGASVARAPDVEAGVQATIQAYVEPRFGDMFHVRIARALADLGESFDPALPRRDTAVGDLVSDALREATGAQIGVTTLGLTSDRIYAGAVVPDDVFRTVAYGYDPNTGLDWPIGTFEIYGFELVAAFESAIQAYVSNGDVDLFPQVSGMSVLYDSTRPPWSRVVGLLVGGAPLDPAAVYRCGANYALVVGLGKLLSDAQLPPISNVQIGAEDEYQAVRALVERRRALVPEPVPRIVDVGVGALSGGTARTRDP